MPEIPAPPITEDEIRLWLPSEFELRLQEELAHVLIRQTDETFMRTLADDEEAS